MWMLAHQYLNSWHLMHLLWHFVSCCSCKLYKLWGAEGAADRWLGITWCWNRPSADNSSRKIKHALQLLCVSFPPFPWCLWCVYQHARYNILFLYNVFNNVVTDCFFPQGIGVRRAWLVSVLAVFTYSAFDFCAAEPVGITILPLWSWLRNATFKGTQEFMGKQVDVWMYKVYECTCICMYDVLYYVNVCFSSLYNRTKQMILLLKLVS